MKLFFFEEVLSHKELEDNIGYIYPESLQAGEIQDIMTSFRNKKGIVVDLRCYPSDCIVFSMSNFLMPKPIAFVKFKNHNQKELEGFYMTDPLEVGIDFPDYYKGKIAILVNEETHSNAEYTAKAFQVASKNRVFGSQTAGTDGNVSEIILPGGFKTFMTGIGVYYPDGTETQQVGIRIDETVKPTIQLVREGRDLLLEAALEYLKEE
jgi:C-terminal processing protease CtpA/Prc